MARTVPQGIKLNVGGMAFESTKETLCKSGHLRTFFDLADGVEEGIPFIDRCPVRFAAVLRALRSNKLRARDSHEFEELQDEFAYFGISDEVQLLPPVRKEQMVVYERCEIWCFGESYLAESICKRLSGRPSPGCMHPALARARFGALGPRSGHWLRRHSTGPRTSHRAAGGRCSASWTLP